MGWTNTAMSLENLSLVYDIYQFYSHYITGSHHNLNSNFTISSDKANSENPIRVHNNGLVMVIAKKFRLNIKHISYSRTIRLVCSLKLPFYFKVDTGTTPSHLNWSGHIPNNIVWL